MDSPPKREVSAEVCAQPQSLGRRYEAVLHLSEALSRCREPEDLTKILSEELRLFFEFLQFYILVYKENSTEVEWAVVGRERGLMAWYAGVPVEQCPSWQAHTPQEPFHIQDWNTDERVPACLKEAIATQGYEVGPLLFVPLTMPHRRLGALGVSGVPGSAYDSDDVNFLRLIGRIVAFAIDDNFNLRQAKTARAELQRQNEQLQRREQELRDVIETIPSMAWSAATDGAAEFFNRRWLEYVGLTIEQAQGAGWTTALHPNDLSKFKHHWRGILASGQPGEFEARLRRFDGEYRWFLFRATPALDESGRIVKWYGTNVDIEECKKAEQDLAVQNIRLQLLLKLTSQITSNLDLRKVLRAVSASIRELMHCDLVHISLPDPASGKFQIYALDFPESRGFIKEDLLITPVGAAKQAIETLMPVVRSATSREDFPPDYYELLVAEGVKSQCVIPLVNRGQAVGILAIARTTDNPFTSQDVDFLNEASGQIAIAIEHSVAYREVSELKDKLAKEKLYLEQEIRGDMDFGQIVGRSSALRRVLQLAETVAPSDSTVLLLGETGTGKELIARAIHDRSRRKDRTFVKVNCAAIPTGLLESELFGHERGAFTGAITQKIGRLELADQGTLFLDEVGDIPLEIQPKLLRALQEREFERLGSTRTRKVNIRLIAATNRDLERMVAEHAFRSDLYYRLNVFPIRIPPLRERKDDIPLLVAYFVEKFAKQMQKRIDSIPMAVMKALKTWDWPGNIRELENLMERAVILSRGRLLEAPLTELRKASIEDGERASADQENIARIVKETIQALYANNGMDKENWKKKRDAIVRALTESKGRVGGADGAAARLCVNRTTLLARMKKLGIDPREYA